MRHLLKGVNSIRNLQKCLLQQTAATYSTQKQLANELFTAQYCVNLVEKNDYENYLCTLLLNGDHRRHAFALRAFNVEVANCGAKVTEEHIIKLKLKFWYDSIDKCFSNEVSYVADHPVLRELKNTVDSNKLSKIYLKRLVTARDRPLNQPFLTVKHLEEYAEQVFSSLFHLLVELNGIKDIQVDHAVSHLGKAQGIATLLRAIPYKGRSQALNIPQELLIKHGVSQERIVRDKVDDKGVEECIFEVASVAHQHLEKARSLIDKVPKDVRKFFLPSIAVERYLERLRKSKFRLTDQRCLQRDSMLPISLYWCNLRRRY
ncbi:NADH dehydrogenase (ubiquinone) complex I, assembly factor 6 homolog [Zeugodacus cucurbitae]|uniref:NADH dehydrogenase (ubiquinone) complex I, assembly factor 6 homolog n=1 Tax=Zeugodacus cucurbitae TaxID=28588 RepID=UPI0023D93F24|nr:NADH dehydrogenase (ubiquinone) complex I, assembly factor 6 homolog [Zeugodacus cucurbitae]